MDCRELCRVGGKPLFQLALDTSVFAEASAASSSLIGTLTATSRLGTVLVVSITAVQRDPSGELWLTTEKPLQPGTLVICRQPTA